MYVQLIPVLGLNLGLFNSVKFWTATITMSFSLYFMMILFTLSVIFIAQFFGFWAREKGHLLTYNRGLGTVIMVLWLLYNAYYFSPSIFSWSVSLPIHVCDILGPISALALLINNSKFRALLYFCAIPLAGQAIITPTGNQDPFILRFWFYWLLHAGILAISIYDLTVRKYKPKLKDLFWVIIFDFVYIILVVPLNIIFGWNYGYLGNSKPDVTTAIDFLGPWPERVLLMLIIVILFQFVFYLPWMIHQIILAKQQR